MIENCIENSAIDIKNYCTIFKYLFKEDMLNGGNVTKHIRIYAKGLTCTDEHTVDQYLIVVNKKLIDIYKPRTGQKLLVIPDLPRH